MDSTPLPQQSNTSNENNALLQEIIDLLENKNSVQGTSNSGHISLGSGGYTGRDSITIHINLATVLQELPVNNLQELFEKSVTLTSNLEKKGIYTPNLQQALNLLFQVVDENSKAISYPKFLNLIAQQIAHQQPDIAQKLQQIIKLWPNLGGNLTQEDVQKIFVEDVPRPETVLMVELIPARAKITKQKQRYYVRFYLCQEDTNNYLSSYGTETLYYLSEIPAYIEKVIQRNYSNPKPNLLEIFVSLDILVTAESLDWVEYKDNFMNIEVSRRLGKFYKVALRSLERQRDHKLKTIYRSQWVSKWSYLCQCLPVEKIPFQEKIDLTFLEKLARNWPTNQKRVVATLSQMPVRELEHIIKLLMYAGVPAIVWVKKEYLDTELNQLWEACNQQLLSLIEAVYTLRTSDDAYNDQTHIGNYLTLIWENPYHILPEAISNSGE